MCGRLHRRVVDRSRRRDADAAALPAAAAQGAFTSRHAPIPLTLALTLCAVSGVAEVCHADLHRGADGRQLHPDEEGPGHVPVSPAHRCIRGGGGDGKTLAALPLCFT